MPRQCSALNSAGSTCGAGGCAPSATIDTDESASTTAPAKRPERDNDMRVFPAAVQAAAPAPFLIPLRAELCYVRIGSSSAAGKHEMPVRGGSLAGAGL